jgi:multicomponent Na+:H+ antiporter subunit E
MSNCHEKTPHIFSSAAAIRLAGLLVFWFSLSGADLANLPIGLAASAAAAWISLRLLPPASLRPQALALGTLALSFAWQSIVAGGDVACRALDPRLPLHPGFVRCLLRLPPGPIRKAFCTLSSLLPGTLPTGLDENGALLVHCLDLGQPVATQMSREETLLMHALGKRTDDYSTPGLNDV